MGTNWVVNTIGGLAKTPGSTDGIGTNVLFGYPGGVAVDNAGNIYVADWFNATIREETFSNPACYQPSTYKLNRLSGKQCGIERERFRFPDIDLSMAKQPGQSPMRPMQISRFQTRNRPMQTIIW